MAFSDLGKDTLSRLQSSLSRLQTVYETDIVIKEAAIYPRPGAKEVKNSVIKLKDLKQAGEEPLLYFGDDFISIRFGEKKRRPLRVAFTNLFIEGKHLMNILETLNVLDVDDAASCLLPRVHTGSASKTPNPITTSKTGGKSKTKSGTNPKHDRPSKERDLEIDALRNEIASLHDQLKKCQKEVQEKSEKVDKLEREISLLKTLDKGTKVALISDITRNIGCDITKDELFQELMDKNSIMVDR